MTIQKPKGTLDILPKDMRLWHHTETKIRKICEEYGFSEIRFPTFELSSLFKRGVGSTTDIVQKEMFTLSDKDGNEFCLRPEGTACVARSVIENGLYNDPMPLKLYYIGQFFRYEKPQAGRSREFYQFGVELLGAPSAAADATVISIAQRLLCELGINAKLYINSIGCEKCRPAYHDALKEYFAQRSSELCDTCRERLVTNPLRILDCKSPICKKIAEDCPKTTEHLCDECSEHFTQLKSALDALGIAYSVDPKIVRGLDYYTRTVFEFISDDLGAQSTVCGGGRYNGLISELGGPELGGIGFGLGLTRLMMALSALEEKNGEKLCEEKVPEVFIGSMGNAASVAAQKLTDELRSKGIYAECDIVGRSVKAQMKYADKIGARYALIIGDNELESDSAQLKDLRGGENRTVTLSRLADFFEK